MFTDWFIPGYKAGGPIKSVHDMIRLLAKNYQIHVVTRNTDWMDAEPYPLEADAWIEYSGIRVMYLSKHYLNYNLRLLKAIKREDVVFFNGIYSLQFNSLPILRLLVQSSRPSMIISARGMLNPNALALKPMRKRLILGLMKILGVEFKSVFHAASKLEEKSIRQVFPNARVKRASNIPAFPNWEKAKLDAYHLYRFISIGRISKVKNTDFLIDVFLDHEKGKLSLVGSTDDEIYHENCQKEILKSHGRIQLSGPLSPNILAQEWEHYGFFISCTSGENFGHAIIESLANGVPVIISDRTPWNDIESFGAGWVISLDDKTRWTEILRQSSDLSIEQYEQMRRNALNYVKHKFDADQIRQHYLNLFCE